MPTSHRRIPVTQDPELERALELAGPYFPDLPRARLVHDLAVRGAETVARERGDAERALEELVAFSTERRGIVDWDILDRVDELAWGG